ncbi:MAG: SpoIIE family protein phosphatase [Xanthomonadales bacterium]|nr:SpoIIE family protein phosphatase [Xanthomonadales bacterium]NIN58967.1 SpoIIE family protein phosphatase [Xanthomonadales bacterium]NIN74232.1 SpoIIE family protein phosphatase [Xanthomonadales bacterium]NIO13905.1 SpoIIE family protein phosphatase [Xanthomonadales bacterium]NIP11360.1 SpoIIE family protein phosphatase [Xanthomonadales bacterium]
MIEDFRTSPNEISRESLVQILEIMHRLAAPEAMPELLREIMEVGKVAIVAEAGVLWLLDRKNQELVRVVPAAARPQRHRLGQGWAGECAASHAMSNISECREDERFLADPVHVEGFETRSLLNVPILGQDHTVLGVMQWLGKEVGQFDEHDEWVGPALAAQAAVAVQHAYMTDELLANAILRKEVAVAREIQMSTLPRSMPEVPGYDVHGHFLPTDHTGGDLYDLVMLGERLFMLLGDATGHGFGPALSATQMQAMLRVAFRLGASLDEAYMQVNNQLDEDLPDDRFITAFMGFLDPARGEVEYHSGGQGPILHFRAADGECDWYKPTSFPVGVMPLDGSDKARRLQLAPGDILALISDGVYEYTDLEDSEFGEARVAEIISRHHGLPMAELSQRLVEAAFEFGGEAPQADDITLVLVKRQPDS